MSEEKKPSLEETFAEIETIIEKLESGELDLDESFAFYETGMKKLWKYIEILSVFNSAYRENGECQASGILRFFHFF